MTDLADLFIYGTDEMVDRHWQTVSAEMEKVEFGDEELDAISLSMAEHSFKAGWMACLKAIMDTEQRKDGLL